jgi:hypothetical membrane protein
MARLSGLTMFEISEKKSSLKLLRLSGLCGIFGSVLPLIMVVAATVLSSWFRWDTNALSELGVGEESALFNSAVLLGGVLNFLFALGLRQYLNGEKLVKTGAASVIMSNVCLALVGIFTIDYHLVHGVVALGYFVLAPVGYMMIGFGTKERAVKRLSVACGITAFLAILVLPIIVLVFSFKVGFAVPELIEALVISAWTVFMSAKLIAHGN